MNKTRENVIGRHCYEISHHVDQPCYLLGEQCAVKQTFETGKPSSALHIHHGDGTKPIYVETKSYPLKDEAGNAHSAIETINNITEKKKLEEQLLHSQKLDAIGQLAGGIAHDFNNILTAIMGYGHMVKTQMDEDDPMRHYMEQIFDAAERAANLTRGLLKFGRKETLSMRPVSLNEILRRIEKLLRRIIGEDIEMHVALTPQDRTIMADSNQIEQILMNLATNAREQLSGSICP